ncbi:MAG TPA: YciI family protein [Acidimicrobiia bacterium]|nr:YciI family protein [Acidimicrobiia bacterium]
MPKYAALIYTSAEEQGQGTPEELEQVMNEYNDFTRAAAEAGVMVGGEALHDTNTATTVHIPGGKGGEPVFTDGPFAETKEALGGFYLFDVADLDEALKWAQQIPGAWYGRVEVRPIVEFEDQPEG